MTVFVGVELCDQDSHFLGSKACNITAMIRGRTGHNKYANIDSMDKI
jgi:hypothetical protein